VTSDSYFLSRRVFWIIILFCTYIFSIAYSVMRKKFTVQKLIHKMLRTGKYYRIVFLRSADDKQYYSVGSDFVITILKREVYPH